MRLLPVVLVLLLAAVPVHAQSAEETEVLKPVQQLFDGMRKHDSVMVRGAFAAEGRLVSVSTRGGTPAVQVTTAEQFARAVGSAPGEPWDERIYQPEIRIDGNLATVWVKYDFLRGATWSHCGIDAFMLAKLADGWRITQIGDTRQQQGCSTPAAPRP
jgi:hypothetical protein